MIGSTDVGSYSHLGSSCHSPIEVESVDESAGTVSAAHVAAEDDDDVNFNSQSTTSSGRESTSF